MKNKEIDVFIISYNRLEYLKLLIIWLEKAGFENIHIVDNNSTYPPLLEYLEASEHKIHRMDKNYGHLVVWNCGKFNDIIDNKNYIVTDSDILPIDECPLDVTPYFLGILEEYHDAAKVGFSLKIDDLPECFLHRDSVIDWEIQFWKKRRGEGLFDASIDTTFALYRPGIYPSNKAWWISIRTYYPYVAKHLPWYADSSKPSEEDIYYEKEINSRSSFWSIIDSTLLQKYNTELLAELNGIYKTRKWLILQGIYKFCYFFIPKERFQRKIGKKSLLPTKSVDARILQKSNKTLFVEIGSIKNSVGWRILNYIDLFLQKFYSSKKKAS